MRGRERALAGAVVAVVAVGAVTISPAAALDQLDRLAESPGRYAIACVTLALVRPALAWPASVLGVAVGYGFGVGGAPFALALIVLTAVPPYLFARRLGGDGCVASAGRRLVDAAGPRRSVAGSRLLPTPSDAVSVGAGAVGVRMWPYLVGTTVGEAPWAVAGTLVGASVGRLATTGLGSIDLRLIAVIGVLGVLLLAGPAVRAVTGRQDDRPTELGVDE